MWLIGVTLGLIASPQQVWAGGACTCARFNDWHDYGCHMALQAAGGPNSGAVGSGGNQSSCPTCPPDHAMPRWWVDEPYINLHISDTPLSYRTSSGQEMDFRFLYKQRFMIPPQDQCADCGRYYADPNNESAMRTYGMTNAAWGHNWMMDIIVWDDNWEQESWMGVGRTGIVFSNSYQAMVLRPEGGIYSFTHNYYDTPYYSPALTDPASQGRLQSLSTTGFPVMPTTNSFDANGIRWGDPTNGFKLIYPDGSQDIFSLSYYEYGKPSRTTPIAFTTAHSFLTQRIDPQGRVTQLGYELVSVTDYFHNSGGPSVDFRIKYIVDSDGRTNTFYYNTNTTAHAWQISEIDDPFGRKATFTYGFHAGANFTNGLLTSITDAAGISNAFTYQGTNGWINSLITPYGTTSFGFYQAPDSSTTNGFSERATYVSEPEGAHQLFYYHHQTTGFVTTTTNSPTVPGQSFDDGTSGATHYTLDYRNSFHWDRRQFAALPAFLIGQFASFSSNPTTPLGNLTTANYNLACLKHWLLGADGISITESLSSERDPSPDAGGTIVGARTWYNYANKSSPESEGDAQINCVARLLPDVTSQYTLFHYYSSGYPFWIGLVSDNESTFSLPNGSIGVRTNWFQYAGNGIDLLTVSNSFGQNATFINYANHLPQYRVETSLLTTTFSWDSGTHNLTSIALPSGQTVNFNYNSDYIDPVYAPLTNTTAMLANIDIEPQGLEIDIADYTNGLPRVVHTYGPGVAGLWQTNFWDNLNRLTGVAYPDGTSVSNIFTLLDLTAQKDRLGNWTRFGYDGLQHLTSITNALMNVTQLSWCGCGALMSIIDAFTNTTTLNYDNQGNLTNVALPDSSSLNYRFDLAGRMTNVFDGSGRGLQLAYNNQGLVTTVSNAFGLVSQVVYDGVDRPASVTDANNVTITNSYDVLNRLTSRTWTADGLSERFGYSAKGLIAYTNRDSQPTLFGLNEAGRVTAVTNANQQVTQFRYDAAGRITNLIDGLIHTTAWHYNEYGWMTNKVDTLSNEVLRLAYNANGQVTNRWMPASTNTAYTYDAVGNLKAITYPQATNSYAYDALNRLTNMIDAVGTSAFTYTPVGHLQSEIGPWVSSTVSYFYSQGHRTNLTLNSLQTNFNIGYAFDNAWRLQSLTAPSGTFGYGYSVANPASALVQSIALPNFASITNHYDALGRQDATALVNYWGHVLDGYSYIHDPLGLRTNITRNFGLTTNSVAVGYDNIGQLNSWLANESGGAPRFNEQLGYGFDAGGNLLSRTNGALVQTFNVDAANQLTNITRAGNLTVSGATPAPAASITINGVSAQTYSDLTFAGTNNTLANGTNIFTIIATNVYGVKTTNVVTANLPSSVNLQFDANGGLTNDGRRSFVYDAENRLTNVNIAGSWKTEFVYDGLNRRRITRDYTWSGTWVRTNETRLICDGMLPIQERDSNNTVQVTYTRGLDLSGSLRGAGGIDGLLARTDTNGSTFYHADGGGNITALMDGNQNMVARYEYDPFGRLVGLGGVMAPLNRMRYSSKWYSTQGDMYDFGFRWYPPNLQRWLNHDPIGELGGLNLFRFVRNNPLTLIDRFGLQDEKGNPLSLVPEALQEERDEEKEKEEKEEQSENRRGYIDPPGGTYIGAAPEPSRPMTEDEFKQDLQNYLRDWKPTRSLLGDCPTASSSTYSRPSGFRNGVRDEVWDNAVESSTLRVRDPGTGRFMSKDDDWDMGHMPGYEFWKHQRSAEERDIDRDQFLDEHNDPTHYRPELPFSNRSHAGEDKTDDYFGP